MALVLANGYSIIREFPAIQLITVALVGLYLVFFHADWAMYLVALSTPFSVIISSKNIHLGLSLPSEALMITLTMIFFARILYDLNINRKFLKHPIFHRHFRLPRLDAPHQYHQRPTRRLYQVLRLEGLVHHLLLLVFHATP